MFDVLQFQVRLPQCGDALCWSEIKKERKGFSFELLPTHTMADFKQALVHTLQTEHNITWDDAKHQALYVSDKGDDIDKIYWNQVPPRRLEYVILTL